MELREIVDIIAFDIEDKQIHNDISTLYFEGNYIKYIGYSECVPLSSVLLSKYTGVNDNTGKKIYEGSIIRYPDNSKNIYMLGQDRVLYSICKEFKIQFDCDSHRIKDITVAGHIFDAMSNKKEFKLSNKEMCDALIKAKQVYEWDVDSIITKINTQY